MADSRDLNSPSDKISPKQTKLSKMANREFCLGGHDADDCLSTKVSKGGFWRDESIKRWFLERFRYNKLDFSGAKKENIEKMEIQGYLYYFY